MSKIKGFTLIELIIVVIIFSIVSYLVITTLKTTTNKIVTPDKFREFFSPDITFYLLRDKIISDKKINIKLLNPVVYDKNLEQIEFKRYGDKNVLFKYELKNGIQNSYILECNSGIFVFKPLQTIKVKSLEEAKQILTMKNFIPESGSFYK